MPDQAYLDALVEEAALLSREAATLVDEAYPVLAQRIVDEILLPLRAKAERYEDIVADLVAAGAGARLNDVREPGRTEHFGHLHRADGRHSHYVQLPAPSGSDSLWGPDADNRTRDGRNGVSGSNTRPMAASHRGSR